MGKGKRQNKSSSSGGDDKRQKRENGEGEYPPAHVLESKAFESYYRECGVVPEGEWDAFLSSLRQPLGVSFRITGHHEDPGSISLRNYMEKAHISRLSDLVLDEQPVPAPSPIPWYPGRMAWRFDVSRSVLRGKGALKNDDSPAARTLAAFHSFLMAETELGAISRQEEVSMVPPCLLDVQPGHVVVDICAAPGSKTQQLIEAINPPRPLLPLPPAPPAGRAEGGASAGGGEEAEGSGGMPSGLVIANDMDYRRCHLLVHQAKRLNSPCLIVTNHDGTMLPTKMGSSLHGVGSSGPGASDRSLRFDRVLCDVPCSGAPATPAPAPPAPSPPSPPYPILTSPDCGRDSSPSPSPSPSPIPSPQATARCARRPTCGVAGQTASHSACTVCSTRSSSRACRSLSLAAGSSTPPAP
jgi:16S rRNA C967 or C1407 C5-methylase (RsmB/RsmF family)